MGISERKVKNQDGKVTRSRIFTVYVDTGETYPSGRKKYKLIKRSIGPTSEVSRTVAKKIYERERKKYKKNKYIPQSPLLAEFIPRYLEHKRDAEGKKSWLRDQYSLEAIASYFKPNIKLSDINSKKIDRYKIDRQKSVSPKTTNIELECLRNLFNLAKTWGEFAGPNPVSVSGLIKRIVRDKRQPLTVEEESLILSVLNPNMGRIFRFGLHTGMRISEIINLEISQIRSTEYLDEKGKPRSIKIAVLEPSDTKTSQGRIIPLNRNAQAALDEAIEFNNERHQRIFLNTIGKPYASRYEIYKSFSRACRSLNMRKITPHDLRRRFASRMVEGGVDLISIRDMMGHVSFKMLESYVTVSTSKIRGVQSIENKDADKPKIKPNSLLPQKSG